MQIKKKSIKLNKLYIIFFPLVLFIIIFFSTTYLHAKSFKITNLEISEEFGLNFNKENVVDKGFKKAFNEGCTIGPPAAIEYAVEPVEEEIIKPSPLYSFTFSLSISI